LPGITRSEVERRGVAGGDRRKWPGLASAVGKTHLTDGARLTERRGRGDRLGKAEPKRKTYFPRRRD
jgi:hypothetical protein